VTDPAGPDHEDDASTFVETGRRGQRLIVEGWFASHADSGTPGPHVHLRTSDGQDPVLRTDQVPALASALATVAERVETMWSAHGDRYAADVVLRSPDPEDPDVIRQRKLRRLLFTQGVLNNLSEVTQLLTKASSTDEALAKIAALLDVDEAEVMVGLARFNLLALTRPATESRLRSLADSQT
jgi:hypothetical protein